MWLLRWELRKSSKKILKIFLKIKIVSDIFAALWGEKNYFIFNYKFIYYIYITLHFIVYVTFPYTYRWNPHFCTFLTIITVNFYNIL